MKNKILIYFLSLAVLLPSTVFAQSLLDRYAPGTSYNPIEMQIVQDPMEQLRLELNALESRLKTQYGYTRYNSCVSSSCVTADSTRDLTLRSSCLHYAESCLARSGTNTLLPVSTRSETQLCQMDHGQNSRWSGGYTANGGIECACNSGYQWEGGLSAPQAFKNTQCVPVTEVSRNQQCSDQWPGSTWTGQLSSQGGSVCGCAAGFQWNDARTRCDAVPAKTNSDYLKQCSDVYGDYSGFSEINAQGQPVCVCADGYDFNTTRTKCVQISPTSPSPAPSGGGGGYTPTVSPTPSVIPTFTYNAELAHDISKKEMITNGSATLRSCPARTCEQKGIYMNGAIFTVRQKYGEGDLWYRGTTPDGNDGWIYSELLTERTVVAEDEMISGPATSTTLTPELVKTSTENQEPVTPKKSAWKKIIGWFTFWR